MIELFELQRDQRDNFQTPKLCQIKMYLLLNRYILEFLAGKHIRTEMFFHVGFVTLLTKKLDFVGGEL